MGEAAGRRVCSKGCPLSAPSLFEWWLRLLRVLSWRSPNTTVNSLASWAEWLPTLQKRWSEEVEGKPLPWYAEAKREEGAGATFLGLTVTPVHGGKGRHWQAIAVGDCCLFQVRDGQLLKAFPVSRSVDFGDTPWLIDSRPAKRASVECRELWEEGEGQPYDSFWLMTDALAQWFLRACEADRKPWEILNEVLSADASNEAFAGWVQERRVTRELHNDDVTLLAVDF